MNEIAGPDAEGVYTYRLDDDELEALSIACTSVPRKINDGTGGEALPLIVEEPVEAAWRAWRPIAQRRQVDVRTIGPSALGRRYFTAKRITT